MTKPTFSPHMRLVPGECPQQGLYIVEATRSFTVRGRSIRAGERGGHIQSLENLGPYGWVEAGSAVIGSAVVSYSYIGEGSLVEDFATITHSVILDSHVSGTATIAHSALHSSTARGESETNDSVLTSTITAGYITRSTTSGGVTIGSASEVHSSNVGGPFSVTASGIHHADVTVDGGEPSSIESSTLRGEREERIALSGRPRITHTTIGPGCVIGGHPTITRCTLGAHVNITGDAHVEGCTIHADACIVEGAFVSHPTDVITLSPGSIHPVLGAITMSATMVEGDAAISVDLRGHGTIATSTTSIRKDLQDAPGRYGVRPVPRHAMRTITALARAWSVGSAESHRKRSAEATKPSPLSGTVD